MDMYNYAVKQYEMDYWSENDRTIVYQTACASAQEAVQNARYGALPVLVLNNDETMLLDKNLKPVAV